MPIQMDRHGPTSVITIDRPESRNALDVPSMRELHTALLEFRDDPSASVGILTGSGDKAFCTGADLKNTPPPETSFAEGYFQDRTESIDQGLYIRALAIGELGIDKPLIAAVNGYALAGGMEMALACDLRVASENASFGLPEPRWATVPATGGISRLLRAMPMAVAMKLLLTGDRIAASEAYRYGLISDLAPSGGALDCALNIAEQISANGPLAVRAIKEVAQRSLNLPLGESVAAEQLMWGIMRDTADRMEGRTAFAERRSPDFKGR